MRRRVLLLLCLVPLGCLDSKSGSRTTDASDDTLVDTSSDAAVDSSADTFQDTRPDTAVDTSADTLQDTRPDTVADTDLDTVADTSGDTTIVPGCSCDPGVEPACDNPCSTPGDVCHRDGYPRDESTTYECAPPVEVGGGCSNQFNEYYHPCVEGLLCLSPFADEDDMPRSCFDCRPQDFEVSGDCEMVLGVFWDGDSCASYSGCSCTGTACSSPFTSLQQCRSYTERPCSGRGR